MNKHKRQKKKPRKTEFKLEDSEAITLWYGFILIATKGEQQDKGQYTKFSIRMTPFNLHCIMKAKDFIY